MKKRIPKALTDNEALKILKEIYLKKYNGRLAEHNRLRNVTMFYCSLAMGLRPREVYNAKIKNIDIIKRSWFIPKEDNKQRFADNMPIPDKVLKLLIKYFEVRSKFYPDSKYVFPTNSKQNRMERSYYDKVFKEALKRSGLYKVCYIDKSGNKRANFNPYSCRHTFCTRAYLKLRDIKKISILARHKDQAMRTTSLYIHCVEDELRSDIMQELYST